MLQKKYDNLNKNENGDDHDDHMENAIKVEKKYYYDNDGENLNEFIKVYNITLLEAIINPKLGKGIRFPSDYNLPTYNFQLTASFDIISNNLGTAFTQLIFGEPLIEDDFVLGPGDVPKSNLFFANPPDFRGERQLEKGEYVGVNKLALPSNLFTAIRAGPGSVEYFYDGRFDIVSGSVEMGVGYTNTVGENAGNLRFDGTYADKNIIEDSLYSRRESVLTKLKAVYVPHSRELLDYKSPKFDPAPRYLNQRVNILISNAPPNTYVGTLKFVQNWEGVPTPKESNIRSSTYNSAPRGESTKQVLELINKKNLIITSSEDEFKKLRYFVNKD